MVNNFPNLKRTAQINSYFCGPATLQMLLSCYDIIVDQQQIVDSLHINQKIAIHGITIQEMGRFIKEFYPQLQFWYKFNSTTSELSQLVNQYHFPVGVEWQGIFDYPDEDTLEDEDDDPGHIAVIIGINTGQNYITIADPDIHYAGADRQFSILQFERRWWDINVINHQEVDDYHGLFLITPSAFSPSSSLQLLKP
jgi:hypothetical protein